MRAWKWMLGLAAMAVLAGCTQPDPACEDENRRLKQRIVQFEHDARNLQTQAMEAQAVAQRWQSELMGAQRQLAFAEAEIPKLRAQVAAAGGGGRGYSYSEKVQQQLESLAEELRGRVVGNRIELPSDFFFDSGQYTLNPASRNSVRRLAEILRGENLFVMIVGHTDSEPIQNQALRGRGINTNLHLSLLRSLAVLNAMQEAGYPAHLMYPTGWGEMLPIASNATAASRKMNRRVEIFVEPAASNIFGTSMITGVEPIAGAF